MCADSQVWEREGGKLDAERQALWRDMAFGRREVEPAGVAGHASSADTSDLAEVCL